MGRKGWAVVRVRASSGSFDCALRAPLRMTAKTDNDNDNDKGKYGDPSTPSVAKCAPDFAQDDGFN
jgi:hypothetical protein